MKRVLMIVYYYPPWGGAGVQRTVKFAKYLPSFGWEPVVVTPERPLCTLPVKDETLCEEVADVKAYYTPTLEPSDIYRLFPRAESGGSGEDESSSGSRLKRYLAKGIGLSAKKMVKRLFYSICIPDSQAMWYFLSRNRAVQIARENHVDAIYSSSPKPTVNLLAAYVRKKTKLPWLADFRDPWDYQKSMLPGLRCLDRNLERTTLENASHVCVVRKSHKERMVQNLPYLFSDDVTVIRNGYDEEDLASAGTRQFSKFTIVYAGEFYDARLPGPLLKAVRKLRNDFPDIGRDLQLKVVGEPDRQLFRLCKKYEVSDCVAHEGYKTHEVALSYMKGAHLLYLDTMGNCVPGKTYEYLAAGPPILALLKENTEVAQMIREADAGTVVDPSDTSRASETIARYYRRYNAGELKNNSRKNPRISRYERRNQTQRLAGLMDQIIGMPVRDSK
ncbi:MAG: glycosyltransferase [Candidatus Brocadiia bacterium]